MSLTGTILRIFLGVLLTAAGCGPASSTLSQKKEPVSSAPNYSSAGEDRAALTEQEMDAYLELEAWKLIKTRGLLGGFESIRDTTSQTSKKREEDAKAMINRAMLTVRIESAFVRVLIGMSGVDGTTVKELGEIEERLTEAMGEWRVAGGMLALSDSDLPRNEIARREAVRMSIDSTLKASKEQEQAERSLRRTLQQLSSRTVIQPNWLLLIPPYDTVLMNSYSLFFKCSKKSGDARLTKECMSKDLSAQELSKFYEKVDQLIERTHTAPAEQQQSTKLSVKFWELFMFDVMDRNAQLTQWEEAVGFGSADACQSWKRKAEGYFDRNRENVGNVERRDWYLVERSARIKEGKCVPASRSTP